MALIRWPLTVVVSMLLFLCCSAKEYYCEYRSGGVNYEQYDLHNDGITVDSRTSITFETRGNNDAHILLQHDRNEFFSNVIEIVIGGWANGKSVIRNAQQGSNLDAYSSTILEPSTYQWFWITWDEGCVQVGKGDSVGSSRIMNWCGFTYNITGMRVSYGFGSDGYFRFPDPDIDECASSPCQNGAQCVNGQNQYTCLCAGGWKGTHCELDTDECLSNPCQNGATCHNKQNSYSCTCVRGWTEKDCDKDINECASNPCQNGASCNNLLDQYTCSCAGGWQGYTCDQDIDECASSPCQNSAQCVNGQNQYTCLCDGGWHGTQCELDTDECLSNPCQNGARCHNNQNSYSCTCARGWTGTDCDEDINECASDPCQNGASCNNLLDQYTCSCAGGWQGYTCDQAVVDGNWGPWSAVTSCSATCGQGRTTRTRQCDNPAPSNGGNVCSGDKKLMETCILQNCTYSLNTTNGQSVKGLRVVSLEVLLLFWTALKACKMI